MKELINRLRKIQENFEFSDLQLAGKIGITVDELADFRSGHLSDSIKENLISEFVEKLEANIYPTKLYSSMHRLLDRTFEDHAITVIGSISGAGKTYAGETYCNAKPDAVFIEVPEVITPRYLLAMISLKLGLPWEGLNLMQMYENIKSSLALNEKLLVFDEADRLNKKMFEILRDIWHDGKGNCGIAFIGDENMKNKIKRGESLKENLIRLLRRVKYVEIFKPIHPDDLKIVFNDILGKNKITEPAMLQAFEIFKNLGGLASIIDLAKVMKVYADKSKNTPDDKMLKAAVDKVKTKF